MVKITETKLEGVLVVEGNVFGDERGFFTESYNQKAFAEAGVRNDFVQDNISRSAPGVLRGLHYQTEPAQTKLVRCLQGSLLDVAVDLRVGSPTFGEHVAVELSGKNHKMLLVPAGFGHGFSVLGNEDVLLMYKVDGYYNAATDSGVRFDDPDLNIDWGVKNPTLSAKDEKLQSFADYQKSPAFTYKR